jgi:outer membrane protein TolC
LDSTFILKSNQVDVLQSSVVIANKLFRSARANYLEVLLTQRDALESKFDLVEVKLNQFQTRINLYRSLGGGWR